MFHTAFVIPLFIAKVTAFVPTSEDDKNQQFTQLYINKNTVTRNSSKSCNGRHDSQNVTHTSITCLKSSTLWRGEKEGPCHQQSHCQGNSTFTAK